MLSPSGSRGKTSQIIHQLYNYRIALEEENEEATTAAKDQIETLLNGFDENLERVLFATLLNELNDHSKGGFIGDVLGGDDPFEYSKNVF